MAISGRQQPNLLIVGASARAAAFSAIRAGFTPAVADLFADADLSCRCSAARVAGYPHALFDWLKGAPDCPWIYTGALENYPGLLDKMSQVRPLYGIAGKSLRRVRQPSILRSALRQNGFAFPAIRSTPPPGEAGWLLKNENSAGGSRVSWWRPEQGSTITGAGTYWQRYQPGAACAATYLGSRSACALLGVTRQLIGTAYAAHGSFRYAGSVGPLVLPEKLQADLRRLGSLLAREFGLRGLFGLDFIWAEDQIVAIEVNPRYTASVEVLELALGSPALRWHIKAFEDTQAPTAGGVAPLYYGKQILFAPRPLEISSALSEALLAASGDEKRPLLADIPRAGTRIPVAGPVLTVFATGESEAAVHHDLGQRRREIESRLAR